MVADEARDRVVVAIRGTFSVADVLADVAGHSESFFGYEDVVDEEATAAARAKADDKTAKTRKSKSKPDLVFSGVEPGKEPWLRTKAGRSLAPEGMEEWSAHAGMLRAARALDKKLRTSVLELAAERNLSRVTLTGHSLGAGAAALLGVMWADFPLEVRVVAIATPACMSLTMARAAAKNTLSVVHRDDIVPRWSLAAVEELRTEVMNMSWTTEAAEGIKEKALAVAGDVGALLWSVGGRASQKLLAGMPSVTEVDWQKKHWKDKAAKPAKDVSPYHYVEMAEQAEKPKKASKWEALGTDFVHVGDHADKDEEELPSSQDLPSHGQGSEHRHDPLYVPGQVFHLHPDGGDKYALCPIDAKELRLELNDHAVSNHLMDAYRVAFIEAEAASRQGAERRHSDQKNAFLESVLPGENS